MRSSIRGIFQVRRKRLPTTKNRLALHVSEDPYKFPLHELHFAHAVLRTFYCRFSELEQMSSVGISNFTSKKTEQGTRGLYHLLGTLSLT